ncbi:hypothetical protein CUMW_282100 [Citrus unshiu]|uniref:Uncharacterized protein n=1 Tax=Citrus unshiu TaxID=55188 RepID=A0A2H5N035_CITUN|nr:hypothetical protein CUMW_282100 [Citrus unshiu]
MAKIRVWSGFSLSGSGPGCHFLSPDQIKTRIFFPGSGAAVYSSKKGKPMMNRGAASLRGCRRW